MKKLFALALVIVLTFGFTTTAFANDPWGARGRGWCRGYESADGAWGRGWCGGFGFADGTWGCPFRDAQGGFLPRADISANLDALVEDGSITEAQRDLWLERFDSGLMGWCGRGGRWQNGARGGGRGFGGGWR